MMRHYKPTGPGPRIYRKPTDGPDPSPGGRPRPRPFPEPRTFT